MTDLRDQLADFETAARRPITLPRTGLGTLLRQLRHNAGMTLDQVGERAHLTRKGICNRELHGVALPTEALVEHAAALGYQVTLTPIRQRSTGTGWPDAGALTPRPEDRAVISQLVAFLDKTAADLRASYRTSEHSIEYINGFEEAAALADGWAREDARLLTCDCGHEGLHAMFHLKPCPVAELRAAARRLGYDLALIPREDA